jgi:hypothetical protein
MKAQDSALATIKCPECGHAIPVTEALSHQITERARAETRAEVQKLQSSLARKQQEIEERERKVDALVQERLKGATAEIERKAQEKVRGSVSVEIEDLKNQLAEIAQQRDAAQKAELEARKRARELDERAKNLDLEAARRIDAERQKIQEEAAKRADDEYRLKFAEKEKQIQDAKKANEELKRKLEQGSQQMQGEVLELQLEEMLRSAFPMDHIEPVPKGVNGADVIHQVLSRSGRVCGTILWESKRTKAWSDGWLQKLKDDQRKLTAEVAILVSEALPKDCSNFSNLGGIWVTNAQCAIALAAVLRGQLVEIAAARAAIAGAKQKSEVLYEYVSSTEFRHRVESIAEAFIAMQIGLQEEKRTAQRVWAKREKQLEQVLTNTSGMYGELQALIALPDIPALTAGAEEAGCSEEPDRVVVKLPARARRDSEREELPL